MPQIQVKPIEEVQTPEKEQEIINKLIEMMFAIEGEKRGGGQ